MGKIKLRLGPDEREEADTRKSIGIHLHSNNSVVVVGDEEGRVLFQKRIEQPRADYRVTV